MTLIYELGLCRYFEDVLQLSRSKLSKATASTGQVRASVRLLDYEQKRIRIVRGQIFYSRGPFIWNSTNPLLCFIYTSA